METIPQLSEAILRDRFDPQSWQRGRRYARDDAIINARRQGMTLRASCIGSQPQPYRVLVTFDARGIAEAECSCPVGDGGYCKHVVALLLTWMERPDAFVAMEDLDSALERRDKGELIALIKQMLQRHPDLDTLVTAPHPDPQGAPVNPQVYRRQIATLLARDPYEWGSEIGIGWDLREMVANGDAFLRQGNYDGATNVYTSIAAEIIEQYEMMEDEEGALLRVIGLCAAGLGECLRGETEHTDRREEIIEALLGIFDFVMQWGDIDEDIPALFVRHTTADEKRLLAGWVAERLSPRASGEMDYRRGAYGALLLDLEGPGLDDATFLRICRQFGRILDFVDRLLALGRTDEATVEAARSSDYELLQLADLFVRHDQGGIAARLLDERAGTSDDGRILIWLREYHQARGEDADALTFAERLFRLRPGFAEYREVRALATRLGRWEALRPALLALLTPPHYRDLLMQIALDEGDHDRAIALALETMERAQPPLSYSYYGTPMTLEVAKAVEKERPHGALEICQLHAQRLIDQRGRENYRTACTYLKKIRDLYDEMDQYEGWEAYFTALREKHRTLRALKEEIAAADLLD